MIKIPKSIFVFRSLLSYCALEDITRKKLIEIYLSNDSLQTEPLAFAFVKRQIQAGSYYP